jgi:hypothetical protein
LFIQPDAILDTLKTTSFDRFSKLVVFNAHFCVARLHLVTTPPDKAGGIEQIVPQGR